MKDRIRQIMEQEQLSPSAFADKLQLGRAVVSHILNGRNNPSLDVVTRILSQMNYINPDWLITGVGNMYKNENPNQINSTLHNSQPDLFSQTPVFPSNNAQNTEHRKEIIVEHSQKQPEGTENKEIIYQKAPDRKITKIIIYYSDNTFETFDANKNAL